MKSTKNNEYNANKQEYRKLHHDIHIHMLVTHAKPKANSKE